MKTTRSIYALYAFNFLKSLQFFGAVAVPFYLYRVHLNYTQMFTLEMIFSVSMFLLEIPTGVVADKFGRKLSLFLGALAFGGAFCLFGVTVSWPILALAEVICACGMCLMSGADRAILFELAKQGGPDEDAVKINAHYDAFGTAGMLIAFPAGTLFAGCGLIPYETALAVTFFASGVAILLAAAIVFTVRETPRAPLAGSAIRAGLDGFKFIFKKPALRSFSLNYAVVSSLTFFMFWFYQSLLIENKFPVSYMGFIAAGFNALAMLMLLATGRIQKTLGTGKTLLLSSLIPGLLYLAVFFVSGSPMALVAIFGVTALKMFRAPMLTSLMNEHIADENRATVLSGVSMLERILTAAFYPLAGLLTDISLSWTFLVMGTLTVCISLFLRIDDRHIA
jgi:MFS family permease